MKRKVNLDLLDDMVSEDGCYKVRLEGDEVWNFIREHSTIFDRMSGIKMMEMTFAAIDIIEGRVMRTKPGPSNWKFYGKDGPFYKIRREG